VTQVKAPAAVPDHDPSLLWEPPEVNPKALGIGDFTNARGPAMLGRIDRIVPTDLAFLAESPPPLSMNSQRV